MAEPLPGTYDNSYDYLCLCLARRTELNRQQQFRGNILAHQRRGDDHNPSAAGPMAEGQAKAWGKGKGKKPTDGGNASGGRTRSASQVKIPLGVCCSCWKTGTCAKGSCPYERHMAPTSKGNPKSKANGRGQSTGRCHCMGTSRFQRKGMTRS